MYAEELVIVVGGKGGSNKTLIEPGKRCVPTERFASDVYPFRDLVSKACWFNWKETLWTTRDQVKLV